LKAWGRGCEREKVKNEQTSVRGEMARRTFKERPIHDRRENPRQKAE